MKNIIILFFIFSCALQSREYSSYCESIANSQHYSKGILAYADDKPDILLSIEQKIFEENNSKILEFVLASYDSYLLDDTDKQLFMSENNGHQNEIFVKTYEDIQKDFIYSSGRTFIILSNGVKIQMQDIKINSDSSYDVFPVKHLLLEDSPILDLTVYPIVKIEFELLYCKTNVRDISKKTIVNKQNIVGNYTPYKPFTYREAIKCTLNSLGFNTLNTQNLFNSSDLLGPHECNNWEYEALNLWPYSLPLVCDPKFGLEEYEITISPSKEGVFFEFVRPSTSIYEKIVNVKLNLENGEKVIVSKPIIKKDNPKKYGIKQRKGFKYFINDTLKIDKDLELLGNYVIIGIEYDVYYRNYNDNGLTFKESVKPIFTRETRKEMNDFRFFIACKIQKAKTLRGSNEN